MDCNASSPLAPRLLSFNGVKYAFFLLLIFTSSSAARAATQQAVLDEINLARTHPHEYANIVAGRMCTVPGADLRCVAEAVNFLERQHPIEPLQSVTGLEMSARAHVNDQGPTGKIGHHGTDSSTPWARMARCGQCLGRAGENISYGYTDARSIVVTLIVDQGVPDLSHRRNIFSRSFKVAGAACGPHARYGAMCVIDFANGFADKGEKVATTDPWRGI